MKNSAFQEEQKRLGRGPVIAASGLRAERNKRRYLIRKTVEAWKNVSPRAANAWAKAMRDLDAVDVGTRAEKGRPYTKIRLPVHLWRSLRRVFSMYGSEMEGFGSTDDDITILREEFPKLVPPKRR